MRIRERVKFVAPPKEMLLSFLCVQCLTNYDVTKRKHYIDLTILCALKQIFERRSSNTRLLLIKKQSLLSTLKWVRKQNADNGFCLKYFFFFFTFLLIVVHYQGRCTPIWQFCGLHLVPWQLSSQSLAGLALGSKTRMVKSTWLPDDT